MKDQIILYNGPNSPFGRKTKITSLVQEVNLEEKKKEIEKEQKKIIAKKQKEYNLLNQEKKVICDDGVERIYRANMFGIIKEKIDEQLICNGKNNPNILYAESPKMLTSYNDSDINLGMIYYNWYSETGKLLVFRTAAVTIFIL